MSCFLPFLAASSIWGINGFNEMSSFSNLSKSATSGGINLNLLVLTSRTFVFSKEWIGWMLLRWFDFGQRKAFFFFVFYLSTQLICQVHGAILLIRCCWQSNVPAFHIFFFGIFSFLFQPRRLAICVFNLQTFPVLMANE